MRGRLIRLIVAGALGLPLAVFLALRTKSPRIQDGVRRIMRDTVNREQLRTAGSPGARAALLHHRGRRSGRDHATPVTPAPTEDGFVIALPYGDRADWVRNVLAAGEAALVLDGIVHRLSHPELVDMSTADRYFVPGDRRLHRLFGVDRCLRLHAI